MPHIYAVSDDETCYIQQDLGHESLYDALANARKNGYNYGQEEVALLEKTLRMLAHVQIERERALTTSNACLRYAFHHQAAMFDLNYFKYSFLKTTDLPFNEIELERDMQQFAKDLAGNEQEDHYFLYRDFQARNVML